MSIRHAHARHRATPVRRNPMETLSKAVSFNAGTFGRQAIIVVAASGLALGLAAPSQAQQLPSGALSVPTYASSGDSASISATTAPKSGTYKSTRASVTSSPAPRSGATHSHHTHAAPPVTSRAGHSHAASKASTSGAQGAATTRHTHPSAAGSSIQPTASTVTVTPQSGASKAAEDQGSAVKTASSGKLGNIASMALSYKGAPYVWGGDSPAGWDCSGFIQYVYGKAGISLPHNTTAIRTSGKFVKTSNPKPGDLVYQNNGSHAGIYIGNGKIIGAQNPSVGTVIRDADSPYGPLMGYYTLAS
ncbi:C40 family peptidase [Neomicrococcus lactis]|uniref:C40 family peptidase n=1 Tax=Neomicrococcus lactis TaxID=732241 RepID=UPI002300F513|nr:C40 family peptidase [Neomicrococcus lactis]